MPLFQTKNNIFFEVFSKFRIEDTPLYVESYGEGTIHKTYRICTDRNCFILQEINSSVFRHIGVLQRNLSCLKSVDPDHRLMPNIFTTTNGAYFVQEGEHFYRLMEYIPNAGKDIRNVTVEVIRQAARGFATFYLQCNSINASEMAVVIPDFHHLIHHKERLSRTIAENTNERLQAANRSLKRFNELLPLITDMGELVKKGSLPVSVVHNNASISNILTDKDSGEFKRIIDLDMVMPGSVLYDFGNFSRSVLSLEINPESVQTGIDLYMFEVICEGYSIIREKLTDVEKNLLFDAVVYMTALMVIRFLADYVKDIPLRKDADFTDDDLAQANTQLELLEKLLKNEIQMKKIIAALF